MATKVTLAGKEYAYAFNLGAMMHYERMVSAIEGNPSPTATTAMMHYACLLSDKSFTMSADEFLAVVDSAELLQTLNAAHAAEQERWTALNPESSQDNGDDSKKK